MKKLIILLTLAFIPWLAVPGDCFIDYLFGGSATSDAIGNNVVGDLRSWWSGNPVYNFNPYYSGGNQPGQNNQGTAGGQNTSPMGSYQGAPPQAYNQQNQQPSVTYYPPQGQQYNYNQGQQQPMQQQQYQAAPQPYQMQQQAPPQAYYQQGPQQQYQGPPQGYEQVPQQQYQGPPQGYEQGPQQYQQAPRGGGYQSYQYEQETPQNE